MRSDGDVSEILTRPWALVFLCVALVTLVAPTLAARYRRNPSPPPGEKPS
jgi:TctA family transporter